MYYAGEVASAPGKHCIGVATAENITGPYTPATSPLICDLKSGGAIDPSGFQDPSTKKRYVVYKVDGNSLGNGGDCGNTVEPIVPTPIMLQELEDDGFTPIGDPVQLLDRIDEDGPLVEAPNLIYTDQGQYRYVLFYSSHCWNTPQYSIRYAVSATNVSGPYEYVFLEPNFPLLRLLSA